MSDHHLFTCNDPKTTENLYHRLHMQLTQQVESNTQTQNHDTMTTSQRRFTPREINKLKKKKQKGKLTEQELANYAHILCVEPSVVGKVTNQSNTFSKNVDCIDPLVCTPNGLVGFETKQTKETMIRDILINDITIHYQDKTLLKETSLKIVFGRKYGLIGPNGSGKSTLLRHISNRHLPIPSHIHILHVEQEAEETDKNAIEFVVEADKKRLVLMEEQHRLKLLSETGTEQGEEAAIQLVQVCEELRQIQAYNAEARASAILTGLQFTEEMKFTPTKLFSGGWRMRIALARALFLNPDLLILDEPTNHLDLNATIWLETYLHKYKKTLLVVSHDRDFLNYFTTNIIHLNEQNLDYYKGNYDTFENILLNEKRTDQNAKKIEQKRRQALQYSQTLPIKEMKKINQQAHNHTKKKDYKVAFEFDMVDKQLNAAIEVKDVSFTYHLNLSEHKWLFRHVDHRIDMDTRVAIVGPNGVGKSTFVKLICGELEPTQGQVVISKKLRTIKFTQHFVDALDMNENALTYLQKNHPTIPAQQLRNALGRFGLSGKTHTNPMALLSGGQKSRVIFTNISLTQPHVIFMDEPTNHLDIQSVDALTEALLAYRGGIVLISHDQRLISRVCDTLWVIQGDQNVVRYEGNFEQYRQEQINAMDDHIFN